MARWPSRAVQSRRERSCAHCVRRAGERGGQQIVGILTEVRQRREHPRGGPVNERVATKRQVARSQPVGHEISHGKSQAAVASPVRPTTRIERGRSPGNRSPPRSTQRIQCVSPQPASLSVSMANSRSTAGSNRRRRLVACHVEPPPQHVSCPPPGQPRAKTSLSVARLQLVSAIHLYPRPTRHKSRTRHVANHQHTAPPGLAELPCDSRWLPTTIYRCFLGTGIAPIPAAVPAYTSRLKRREA